MKLKAQSKKTLQNLFITLGFLLIILSCSGTISTESTTTLSIDYGTGEFYIALVNTAVNVVQKNDFGSQSNFSVRPSLPSDLVLNVTNGNISGSPTVVMLPREYIVTATVDGNSYIKTVTLGVAPSQVWVTNTNSAKPYELTAYVVGGRTKQAGVSWSTSDESLATVNNGAVDIKTSSIGGDVDIIATKDGNTGKVTFAVAKTPSTTRLFIDYGTGAFHIAFINSNVLLEQKTDFGSEASFFINPRLPSGLSLNTVSGSISGIPTVSSLPTEYTVTATPDNKTYYIKTVTLGVAPSQVWVTNTNSAKPYELTAYVVGGRTKQTGISWSSSDISLATVNSNGVVDIKTSSTGGDVVITATKEGNTGTVTFNVAAISYSGSFEGATGHSVSGQALVSSNKAQLMLSSFSTDKGPDLEVWLAKSKSPNLTNSTSYKSLGNLIYADNESYNLPTGVDLDQYSYVLVWCKKFSVLFGSAQLRKVSK